MQYEPYVTLDNLLASFIFRRARAMDIDSNELASKDFTAVIRVLDEQNITVTELVNTLFTEKRYKRHPLTKDLLENAELILPHILGHSRLPESAGNVICALIEPMYAREVRALADCADLRFSAQKMNAEDIEDFKLEELSDLYAKRAPRLWSLLGSVLKARKRGASLLLQSGPMTASSSSNLVEHPDNDEARLEGAGQQRSISNSSQEDKSALLLQIVCALDFYALSSDLTFLEKVSHCQYRFAEHKSKSKYLCKFSWRLSPFLPHATEGH
jgi:hypothetical protein